MKRFESYTFENGIWISKRRIHAVPMHWHSFYEIELCLDGVGEQIINGSLSQLNKGVLSFLSPQDFHRIESFTDYIEFFTISFDQTSVPQDIIKMIHRHKPPFKIELLESEFSNILKIYDELLSEQDGTDPLKVEMLQHKIALVCIEVIRKHLQTPDSGTIPSIFTNESRDVELLRQAVKYINEHFGEKLSRNGVANMLHINSTYFSEIFKRNLGISFSDYVIDLRMADAMSKLRDTDMSITEIVYSVGYNSTSAFYEKFKEYYHLLPTEVKLNN